MKRPFTNDQTADMLEVVEDRSARSTIVTSQPPVKHWHEGLGGQTVVNSPPRQLHGRQNRRTEPPTPTEIDLNYEAPKEVSTEDQY